MSPWLSVSSVRERPGKWGLKFTEENRVTSLHLYSSVFQNMFQRVEIIRKKFDHIKEKSVRMTKTP